jgi:hypothetical protein
MIVTAFGLVRDIFLMHSVWETMGKDTTSTTTVEGGQLGRNQDWSRTAGDTHWKREPDNEGGNATGGDEWAGHCA